MKTLVVEDDFTSRLLMQKLLAPDGERHVAVNGREAVQAFRNPLRQAPKAATARSIKTMLAYQYGSKPYSGHAL